MNKKINWYSVEITVKSEASEAIEFALNELDSLGNEINNLGKKDSETLTVIGYFNDLPSDLSLQDKLNEALDIYGFSKDKILNVETKEIKNRDWLSEWKKHWKPTEIGKFIISPPWENPESSSKIIIKIEPNMAFGTGTHETTKLCLSAIEKNYKSEMSFLDVGTGTGILSIAVAKVQGDSDKAKGRIIGCDTDADSVNIARDNSELNHVNDIVFNTGSIGSESPHFDFICANVTADIIIPLLPILVEKSTKVLILSGILVEQKEEVLDELRKLHIDNSVVETDGEWISLTINK